MKARVPTSISALTRAIRALPSDPQVVTPGKWYRSQKEHWLGWLREYHSAGAYGRKSTALTRPRDAEFAYNHIVESKMLLWLAEAAGVKPTLVASAQMSAARARTMMAKSAAVRQHIPWSVIQSALWPQS